MNIKTIEAAFTEAKAAHQAMPHDARPSLDALFIVVALSHASPTKGRTSHIDRTPPHWFILRLDELRQEGGFSATASTVLQMMGNKSPTVPQAKQCGIWLRELGHLPRKSNGRQMFNISPA